MDKQEEMRMGAGKKSCLMQMTSSPIMDRRSTDTHGYTPKVQKILLRRKMS